MPRDMEDAAAPLGRVFLLLAAPAAFRPTRTALRPGPFRRKFPGG
jgi:hypothetical protein